MKNTMKIGTSLLLIAILIFCVASCGENADEAGLWANATYQGDTTLGSGANTVRVEVTAADKTVVLTLKTDKATLGEALFELNLINDVAFFNVCNGITADWDKDKAYWAFYVGDEMAMYGVNDAKAVTTGTPTYKITYTK